MKKPIIKLSTLLLLSTLLAACGDDGDTGPQGPAGPQGEAGADGADGQDGQDGVNGNSAVYIVTLTNLTHAQPLAPAAIILHESGYHAFSEGEAASMGIEVMAEGGNPSMVIDEAMASTDFLDAQNTGNILAPRMGSDVFTLVVPDLDADDLRLTVTTMLVNTNDAFTGLNAADVSNMSVGETKTFMTVTWDAGTEANTETATSIPGPAAGAAGGGGEAAGYDPARDDLADVVRLHSGVITNANAMDPSREGLATSILAEAHRFDFPTSRIAITRTR
ncbi:spondin domain-containing protein [Alteromonas sp. D210916BOD_24]|uniref:spondin domain-containing protein n=1 Tax=Alteromonas sp. D210916BOD_24 TaxID=3157618 RepID=UPI00399CE1AB